MSVFSVSNVVMKGVCASVPAGTNFNDDFHFDNDAEKRLFIKTTGVNERRIAPEHISTGDLMYASAYKLLKDLNWNPKDVDVLITATQSPDYILPALSPILQHKLNMRTNAMCFDLSIGCSGFVYASAVIAQMMHNGNFKKGILLCGDKSSVMLNKKDKATFPLFGDACAAIAFEYNEKADDIIFDVNADGSDFESIIIEDGGTRNPGKYPFVTEEIRQQCNGSSLKLDGLKVFSFSTSKVPQSILNSINKANIALNDVDFFILHQANKLIIETIRKKLKVEEIKFLNSIEKFGNTSSASIPLSLVYQKDKISNKNLKLVFCGFGVGLSWATCIVNVNQLLVSDIIELS